MYICRFCQLPLQGNEAYLGFILQGENIRKYSFIPVFWFY